MSLGFLTESALLPSKAKAIRVDSKSLVDLKAVVFQKEQERQERKRQLEHALHSDDDDDSGGKATTTAGMRGFGKYAKLRAKKARGKALSKEEEQTDKCSNRGVETRRKRDEAAQELVLDEDDDAAWHKKSKEMLEKKAKMYDDMMKGGKAAAGECLVDFSAKQRASRGENSDDGVESSSQQVEITDEFGRVRFVARGSVEHTDFLQSQAGKRSSQTVAAQKDAVANDASVHSNDQHNAGSFVVSQWEKRFNAQEKTYLQEVHEGVNQAKSALHEKKMRKQLRLEKLKRQAGSQQNVNAAPATVNPLNVQEERAAAVKATEFLNQFGSLM